MRNRPWLLVVPNQGSFDRFEELFVRQGLEEGLATEESDGFRDKIRFQGTAHDEHRWFGVQQQRGASDIEPIDCGHEKIRQDEVPRSSAEHLEALVPRTRDRDIIPSALQETSDGSPHLMGIINEEYPTPDHDLVYHNIRALGSPLAQKKCTIRRAFDESWRSA